MGESSIYFLPRPIFKVKLMDQKTNRHMYTLQITETFDSKEEHVESAHPDELRFNIVPDFNGNRFGFEDSSSKRLEVFDEFPEPIKDLFRKLNNNDEFNGSKGMDKIDGKKLKEFIESLHHFKAEVETLKKGPIEMMR